MAEFALSQVQPDFDSIVEQLSAELATKESWQNFLNTSTAKIFIDLVASTLSSSRYSIIAAAREAASIHSARLPSSVYAHSRALGIHLIRKKPAEVTVDLFNTGTVAKYIDRMSQFTVGEYKFFNRDNIIFNEGTTYQEVTLYQGEVVSVTYTSDGRGFQYFTIGDPDFAISNDDVLCEVGSTEYERTILGLWNYSGADIVFFESTLSDGKVEVIFGDNQYGKIPPIGEQIIFTYAKTEGKNGNSLPIGLEVKLTTDAEVSGASTSISINGSNQLPYQIYRVIAPGLFAAQDRATTRQDYKSITLTYPGVVDVVFRGQTEIAPNDKSYMNIVQIILLTETLFTTDQWDIFIAWLRTKALWNIEYERVDPETVEVNITIDIYCFKKANLTEVRDNVSQALRDFLSPKVNCLGKNLYKSDLQKQIFLYGLSSVDYVSITEPATDTTVTYDQYVTYGDIILNMYYTSRE